MSELTFYEYLMQHRNDPAWDAIHNDADLNRLKRVSADLSGFAEMTEYLSCMEVELSWMFDVFLDSWRKYFRVATGKELY